MSSPLSRKKIFDFSQLSRVLQYTKPYKKWFYGSISLSILLAMVIGTILGSLPVAYLSTWGPHTGTGQLPASRMAFGATVILPAVVIAIWQMAGTNGSLFGGVLPTPDRAWQAWKIWAFGSTGRPQIETVPAASLSGVFTERRSLIFILIWFGTNLIFGAGAQTLGFSEMPVAWIAHLGGFIAGLVLFPLFDRPFRAPPMAGELAPDPRSMEA